MPFCIARRKNDRNFAGSTDPSSQYARTCRESYRFLGRLLQDEPERDEGEFEAS